MNQITDICEQLEVYGLVAANDVSRLGRKVAPYVFNIDYPVPAETMRKVRDSNESSQVQQGRERRQKAAIATNEIVQQTVSNQFLENGIEDEPSDRVSVAFEQEEQTEAGEKRIEEGYKVSSTAPIAPAPKLNKSGNRRGVR